MKSLSSTTFIPVSKKEKKKKHHPPDPLLWNEKDDHQLIFFYMALTVSCKNWMFIRQIFFSWRWGGGGGRRLRVALPHIRRGSVVNIRSWFTLTSGQKPWRLIEVGHGHIDYGQVQGHVRLPKSTCVLYCRSRGRPRFYLHRLSTPRLTEVDQGSVLSVMSCPD